MVAGGVGRGGEGGVLGGVGSAAAWKWVRWMFVPASPTRSRNEVDSPAAVAVALVDVGREAPWGQLLEATR